MNTITQMYKSRETMVEGMIKPLTMTADLNESENQTDDQLEAIRDTMDELEDAKEDYFAAMFDYNDEPSDETWAGVQLMAENFSSAWASAQIELSKFAVLMGIEGNRSFQDKLGE